MRHHNPSNGLKKLTEKELEIFLLLLGLESHKGTLRLHSIGYIPLVEENRVKGTEVRIPSGFSIVGPTSGSQPSSPLVPVSRPFQSPRTWFLVLHPPSPPGLKSLNVPTWVRLHRDIPTLKKLRIKKDFKVLMERDFVIKSGETLTLTTGDPR